MALDELEIRPLSRTELRTVYHTELVSAFPRSERRPLFAIERLLGHGVYDTLGLLRENQVLAYAFFWRGAGCALLDYLGVTAPLRGQGLGGEFLQAVLPRYKDLGGVLAEVEAPSGELSPEESELRQRRIAFYLRMGFRQLTYEAELFGVHYLVLAFGPVEEARAMVTHRKLYWEELMPGVRRWAVKIPRQG